MVTNGHHITRDIQLDITATPLSTAATEAEDIAEPSNFNANNNAATPKQDRNSRQNRYL
ncbi:MAG: hypothetical protein PVH41_06175 [Anaerolineae bacterium]